MRLLFDQNLSQRLVQRLADVYPDSCHVREIESEQILRIHLATIQTFSVEESGSFLAIH